MNQNRPSVSGDPAVAMRRQEPLTRPRIGSLFSGYGGLEMGVQAAIGGTVAWHCENDPAASKVLAHRYPGVPNLGDITKVDWSQVEPVDVLTGGSPCQDVSHAGKRAGMKAGTRSGLWAAMCDAIDALRPSLVVWENVRGVLSAEADSALEPCAGCVGGADDGTVLRALGRVLGDLAELGFDAEWCGLRAADIGAPHGRFRVFVAAYPAGDAGRVEHGDSGLAADADDQRHEWHGSARDGWAGPADGSLLPTPTSRDGKGPNQRGDATCLTGALMPIPRATDGTKGGPGQRGSSGDLMLPSAVALLPTPAVNDDQKRIIDRSEVDPETGCWLWTGWTNQAATPYGRLSVDGTKVYAHRASYEAFVGPIPDGHEIDHLCQASLCVNPEHLEAVSPEENRDRVTERRTHCKHGHEFTEENTYWVRPGARACRACRAWQDKVQKARRKGEEIPLLPTPVTNDMGEGKTVEAWDSWTAAMQERHGNGNGHGKSLAIEAQRLLPTPTSKDRDASGGNPHTTGTHGTTLTDATVRQPEQWGVYAAAIHRWENLTRPAPPPTMLSRKGTPQLSPRFSEWMLGLSDGWVTDVPGLSRNDMLRILGNGVVPQQAALALLLLNVEASGVAA